MLDGVLGYKFLWFFLQGNQQLGLPEVFDSKMTCLLILLNYIIFSASQRLNLLDGGYRKEGSEIDRALL